MKTPSEPCRLQIESLEERCLLAVDAVLQWNAYMLQAEANDFTPSIVAHPDEPGPTGASRAFAIISAAVYDAANSIVGSYAPYLAEIPNARGASVDAAVGQAAHDTLVAMFPSQQAMFDQELTTFLRHVPGSARAKERGIDVGHQAAVNILAARTDDGSQAEQIYTPYPYPGYWQPDPLHPGQVALHPQWGEVRPFALASSNQFRASDVVGITPQSRLAYLNSQDYTDAYNQVMELGAADSTVRTADQTQIGIFWGYDGVPNLGTPPRAYNQIIEIIARQEHNSLMQNARLFALTNIAMADAGIACWESKYAYNFWRPITGIRNADSTGNPNTPEDPNWVPLGAQADNGSGTNFTPGFPSYDSGHATFGASFFQVLRDFYGTDHIAFSWQSDEYNGVTRDANGNVRPAVTRHYDNLEQAQYENFISRVYLGVHWIFDQQQGDIMGTNVGNYVFQNILRPRGRGQDGLDGGDSQALAVDTTPATPVVGVVPPGGARLVAAAVPAAAVQSLLMPAAASQGVGAATSLVTLSHAVNGSQTLTPANAIDLSMSLPDLFA